MRRKDREITAPAEILAVLRRCDVCNVAFAEENRPYVVPMNFGILEEDGKTVLCFHCAAEGRKLDVLARNDRVAFAASCGGRLEWEDSGHCTMRYESVCGNGRMRRAVGAEKIDALNAIMDHYRPENAEKQRMDYPQALLERTVILKLEVEELTGKRSVPAAKRED